MERHAEEVFRDALALPVESRAELIDSLIESLDQSAEDGAEEAWAREIEDRIKQIDAGAVELLSWKDGRERLRKTAARLSASAVRIHPAALDEAKAATAWYARQSRRAAQKDSWMSLTAVDRISGNPREFPLLSGVRRVVLNRLPFVLVFRESANVLEIVAVAHTRRYLAYWRERLE